ncbi:MAG TPA: signal peptidase I [Candidatus Binatia bacterium]|jgi:signal peptidase I|nr:signal peptidase I [Candidatus Binatia bacterium]
MPTTGTNDKNAPSAGWGQRVLIGRDPRWTVLRIAILVVVSFVVSKFVLLPIRVQGISMEPTYKDHRVNFVNRLAYVFHEPRRGDVVAIRTSDEHIMYMKRIIGLPGETVAFHERHAIINGQALDEPYVKQSSDWERPTEPVGPDEYYVVGDNRSMDWDEHTQGRAKRERIVGKILL